MTDLAPADLSDRAEEVAARLALIANAKRLLVLCALAEGELSVGALQMRVDLSQSALSQHLAKLREGGVVATRRAGQVIYYRLEDPQVVDLMTALHATFCQPDQAQPDT